MKHLSSPIQKGLLVVLTLFGLVQIIAAAPIPADQLEFFENKIRPVLAQECYECHNSRDKAKSGLILDYRDGLLKGGDLGPSLVQGKPDESILMEALRHEYDLEMPKAGVKLDPPIVANFEKWIAMGAPDPRDNPPSDDELAADTSWDAILETRKNWWSFQPIKNPTSHDNVDAFLQSGIESKGLKAAAPADPLLVMRRLYFAITGLPPTPEQIEEFRSAEQDPKAKIQDLANQLLDSPQFGERWARHWMDWIRYAESHGSEGDPRIDNAHLYRDYLIRALNKDIPYNQLLREHLAGDLIDKPRLNKELGVNESMIATAHWRMVFHGFAPTDALDEKVRFTDDQINVFTKAFQGLTVSCARCHDHKFDAISQADYYALFGIFGSTRPGRKLIDLPETLEKNKAELAALKPQIQDAVARDWQTMIGDIEVPAEIAKLEKNWATEKEKILKNAQERASWKSIPSAKSWDLSKTDDYHSWFRYGNGLPEKATPAGDFAIAPEGGDRVIADIFPSGIYSGLLSNKQAARLTSPEFTLEGKNTLQVLARGGGNAMVRYVVQNYPRSGTVFKVITLGANGKKAKDKSASDKWKWHTFDLEFWDGDDIHIEFSTARDAPLLTKPDERSWFGIRQAMLVEKGTAIAVTALSTEHLDAIARAKGEDLSERFRNATSSAVASWGQGKSTNADAHFLNYLLDQKALPNKLSALPQASALIEKYRVLETEIKAPTRVHGLDEWVASNQALYDRGDHKKPLGDIPRRFLDAIDPTPYQTDISGRLELSDDLLRDDNPFTRRVIVNRIWHHVFGQGIVPTADNFGRMGEQPSHPELLDFLAVKFSDEFDWSIKKMITYLVTSGAFQRSSQPVPDVEQKDPDNRLLSHFPVKRLEAEAVRDALLVASGKLDPKMYEGSVNGGSTRRSVYVEVIRNRLDPFLSVYDAPVPFSATGRRAETNVPAQSLTMLNNNFVIGAAEQLARETSEGSDEDRIRKMWVRALGRDPSAKEKGSASDFISAIRSQGSQIVESQKSLDQRMSDLKAAKEGTLSPVRTKLQAVLDEENSKAESKGPVDLGAIGHWDFSQGLNDLKGNADLKLLGSARLEEGILIVDGSGMAASKPLGNDLKAKTLEVRVQLDDLNQKGGGAMSVQGLPGEPFDSITYAERRPLRWMPGSSGFRRTKDLNGTDEKDAQQSPVHLVITYHEDGTINAYRNGQPYGDSYVADHVEDYKKGNSQVIFGLRHGTNPGGGRALRGKIFDARLYDRALTPSEVNAIATGKRNHVTEKEVMESLTKGQVERISDLDKQITATKSEREALGNALTEIDVWKNFAHSIFNLKEFIYVY